MSPSTLLKFIAFIILSAFVLVWAAVLLRAWFDPSGNPDEPVELSTGLVTAAGTISTLIATQTASVLGFTVGRLASGSEAGLTRKNVADRINKPTYWAICMYLLVGAAVFLTWILREGRSPEIVSAFSLSLLGWLSAGAALAFAVQQKEPSIDAENQAERTT